MLGATYDLSATHDRATTDKIADEMTACGISGCLVRHALARDYSAEEGNAKLVTELSVDPRLLPVATLAPLMFSAGRGRDDEASIRRYLTKHRFRGVAMYPSAAYQNFSVADWCSGPITNALESMRMPLYVDFTEVGAESLAYLLMTHSSLPIVVTSIYYAADRTLFPLLDRHDNLYIVSTIDRQYLGIEDYTARFGAHRILFGSNYPRSSMGASVSSILLSRIDQTEKARIASGTIETLMGGIVYES
jgi:hypothetical protein